MNDLRASAWRCMPLVSRRGGILLWAIVTLSVAGAAVAAIVFAAQGRFGFGGADGTSPADELVHRVSTGHFEHFIVERGDLESSSNEEVRCLVKARGGVGTAILKIRPAGEYVKQGDFLIQFDDSTLQTEQIQQRIVVANAAAVRTQGVSTLETAKATLDEFVEGISKQNLELARSELFVAQENLRRAEEHFRYSQRLAAKNYITAVQLDAERFAVQKSSNELDAAQTKLDVLQNHTYKKTVALYKGDIDKAEAQLKAAIAAHNLEEQRLKNIADQIAKCHVRAPAEGQVVYATQADRSRDEQIVIEEGTIIREGQTVIRLPDPSRMQVRTLVNETRVNLVKPGSTARLELDADPDAVLEGVVTQVDSFPMPKRWNAAAKEYGTLVKITTPSDKLRPGLRAKVRIFVHGEDDVMQVPVQAVVERGGAHYCAVKDQDGWRAQPIDIGQNNEKFVIVRKGLSEGDRVAIDPRRQIDELNLPETPKSRPQIAGGRRDRRGESTARKTDVRADSGG